MREVSRAHSTQIKPVKKRYFLKRPLGKERIHQNFLMETARIRENRSSGGVRHLFNDLDTARHTREAGDTRSLCLNRVYGRIGDQSEVVSVNYTLRPPSVTSEKNSAVCWNSCASWATYGIIKIVLIIFPWVKMPQVQPISREVQFLYRTPQRLHAELLVITRMMI